MDNSSVSASTTSKLGNFSGVIDKINIDDQTIGSTKNQSRHDFAERTYSIVGSHDLTHRSSLGLLPTDLLDNVSSLQVRNSFLSSDNLLRTSTKNNPSREESVSILREACRDSTFKIPNPRQARAVRLIDHSRITQVNPTTEDSIQLEQHLSLKYLLPTEKTMDQSASVEEASRSPSIGWVDKQIASFVAKQTSHQNESVASAREVDWSKVFEKLSDNQKVTVTDVDNAPRNSFVYAAYEKSNNDKQIENQSFSAEALSISLANRPRSTSFGGSPVNLGNNELLTNTRSEGFSDFTNPPGSQFDPTTENDSFITNKLKGTSLLEDSVFTYSQFNSSKNLKPDDNISLGNFQPQNQADKEFGDNSFAVVSDNINFINQAESDFKKEHRFDQFNTPIETTGSTKVREAKDVSMPYMSCQISSDVEPIAKEMGSYIGADLPPESKLPDISAYFAMSTSRLGSLEESQTGNNMGVSPIAEISGDERPNLGFSNIVSPKRKPFSVVSMPDDNTQNETRNKRGNSKESQMNRSNLNDLTHQSQNSYQSAKNKVASNFKDHDFKKPTVSAADKDTKKNGLQGPRKTFSNRHSSPIKLNLENVNGNTMHPSVPNSNLHRNISKVVNNTQSQAVCMNSNNTGGFPVAADKSSLSWLAVEIAKTEEKFVTLRNLTDQVLELRLLIRESNQYTFKRDRFSSHMPDILLCQTSLQTKNQTMQEFVLDTVLQPKEMKSVIVQFTASERCGLGEERGKLVIKPKFNQKLKATIPLYANVGVPKIVFDASFVMAAGLIPNQITTFMGTLSNNVETEKETQIFNKGEVPAFVRLQAFADMDCRIVSGHEEMDPIRIEPNAFILKPGCTETIRICVRPCHGEAEGQNTIVGGILIFSGPEICRQAWRAFKEKEVTGAQERKQYFLHGVDFDVPFQGEKNTHNIGKMFNGPLTGDEETDFGKKVTMTIVKVVGFKSKTPFVTLQIEETLSESRINCTAMGGSPFNIDGDRTVLPAIINYDTIAEEQEVEIPQKCTHKIPENVSKDMRFFEQETIRVGENPKPKSENCTGIQNKTLSTKSSTEDIYLQSTKLFFPRVKIGTTSVEKLVIKNHSKTPVQLTVQSVLSPFKTSFKTVEVKSKSFLKVPIIYAPETAGKHKGKIYLKSDCGKQLESCLIGDSVQ